MERIVGKRMYRGLLKSVARVLNPQDIQRERNEALQEMASSKIWARAPSTTSAPIAEFIGPGIDLMN